MCTCAESTDSAGPHARVGHPFVDFASCADGIQTPQAQDALRGACASHGCFHLRLNSESIKCANEVSGQVLVGDLSKNIESLFDVDFLKSAKLDADGGLQGVRYSYYESPKSDLPSTRCASYRGRTSESGAAGDAEPKQSWERTRCHLASLTKDQCDVDDSALQLGQRLRKIDEWSDALAAVARLVVYIILEGDPSRLVDTKPRSLGGNCSCAEQSNECCVMDLLRVFRYDTLRDESERSTKPGSSAHSDWGTLTVVWQDNSGGLQTYCHECDKWSDVNSSSLPAAKDDHTVDLFVHVGDFLSLVTRGKYPSPRHRVLCPLAGNGSDNNEKQSRCSLVYFAYPDRGLALADVGRHTLFEKNIGPVRYERYSLLHDQSAESSECGNDEPLSSSSRRVYDRIYDIPFDKVIMEKWGQVQRSS